MKVGNGLSMSGGFVSRFVASDLTRSTISGDPIFTGKVMFSEPIYIDNTSSTVKGALCFDIENNLPRLKLLVNGVEYIFNCDTSVTGGAG